MEEYPEDVWKPLEAAPFYPFASSRSPEQLARDMREFISDTTGPPFFLYFCTFEPHHPFKREGSDTIHPEEVIVPSHLPDLPGIRENLAKYYMSAQRADKGMAELIRILRETGQWDNTVILYTSDNGRPFRGAKTNLYDAGIRMPFVFRDPWQEEKGITTDAMVNFADITPTLLDFTGIDPGPYGMHGRSFRSQLGLENDPDEINNLAYREEYRDLVRQYKKRIDRFRERTGDLWKLYQDYEKVDELFE